MDWEAAGLSLLRAGEIRGLVRVQRKADAAGKLQVEEAKLVFGASDWLAAAGSGWLLGCGRDPNDGRHMARWHLEQSGRALPCKGGLGLGAESYRTCTSLVDSCSMTH